MKLLVETVGSIQLLYGSDHVRHNRPSVVSPNYYWDRAITENTLKLISHLSDEATDEEFVKTLNEADGDLQLAVASFIDRFAPKPTNETEKEPPKEEDPKEDEEAPRGNQRGRRKAT